MSFAIVTDSTSDIAPERARELGIYVIPLHVIIEGEDLLDQVEITAEEYTKRMAAPIRSPTPRNPLPANSRRSSTVSQQMGTTEPSLSRCAANGAPATQTP